MIMLACLGDERSWTADGSMKRTDRLASPAATSRGLLGQDAAAE